MNLARIKITAKGLLLVAVPLVFELIFAASLALILFQAESEINQEWHSRLISSLLARMQFRLYSCATNAGGLQLSSETKFKRMYESDITELTKLKIEMLALIGDDRQRARYFAPVSRSLDNAMIQCGLLALPKNKSSELEKLMGSGESLRKLLQVCNDFVASQTDFLAHENAIEKDAPRLRSARRAEIQAILMLGVALSLIICVTLSIYFGSDISGRLRIVGENIKRLKEGKKLLRSVAGHDELAELDAGFRLMALQLAESEAFKKQLVAVVSHELRTPLTSVAGSLSVVESGMLGELKKDQLDQVASIQKDIDNVMKLTSRLLQIERMEAGKMQLELEEIDLDELFSFLVEEAKLAAFCGRVQTPTLTETFHIWADRKQVNTVLSELLENACRFSPENSIIEICVENNSEEVLIHVDDSGPGFTSELLSGTQSSAKQSSAKQFSAKQLSGLDRCSAALGLGLAFCRVIMEAHGGGIALTVSPAGGARVSLRFLRNSGPKKSQKSH